MYLKDLRIIRNYHVLFIATFKTQRKRDEIEEERETDRFECFH